MDSALFLEVIFWLIELTVRFAVKNDSLDSSSATKSGLSYLNFPGSRDWTTVSNVPNPFTTSVKEKYKIDIKGRKGEG